MGQAPSSTNTASRSCTDALGQPTLLGFVSLWLGSITNPQPLPTSWEELLSWTRLASSWQLVQKVELYPYVYLQREEEEGSGSKRDNINFRAIIDTSRADEIARLPSCSWIDRAIFFLEYVRVEVTGLKNEEVKLVRVADFVRFFRLGRNWMELQATLQQVVNKTESSDLDVCEICYTGNETARLPCGHQLCEECEQRWVRRKLSCPFCRERFRSAKRVANEGWNLTEFDHETLQSDVQSVQKELHSQWQQMLQTKVDHADRTFVPMPAQHHDIQDSEGFGIIGISK